MTLQNATGSRQVIMQDGRERYRIARGFANGQYYACIGAFVYDPDTDRMLLDTWASKQFDTEPEREAWIEEVTR